MMRRLIDAEQRLLAVVTHRMAQPFAWGAADCCAWAFDAVAAVTGVDPIADVRGTYRTAWQARRVLRRLGGLRAVLEARLPGRVPPGGVLLHGDVGLLPRGAEPDAALPMGALAVWWRGMWVAQGADGLVVVPGERSYPAPADRWRAGQ